MIRSSTKYPGVSITHMKERLILPGFVDGHIHVPQTAGSRRIRTTTLALAEQWVFPEELKYKDRDVCQRRH